MKQQGSGGRPGRHPYLYSQTSLAEAHYLHHSDQHCRGNWDSLIEPSDPQWSHGNSLTTPPDFIEKRIPLPPHNIFHWQQRKDERLLEES